MKKYLLSTVALAAMAGAASAADLPYRRAAPAPVPYVAVPVFTWTGFYVGGNAGYAFTDNSTITTTGNNGAVGVTSTINNVATGARPGAVRLERDGFTGGGQIGYNYQIGSLVLGVEADAQYTDLARTGAVTGTTGAVSSFRSNMEYIGTVRGRVGYAFDRFLVYGTGGFAYGDVFNRGFFYATPAAGGTGVTQFAGARKDTETGWVAGGGVEYAIPNYTLFNSAVTVKAEALYYDLGRSNVTIADTGLAPAATRGQSYNSRFENNGVLVRAGLNFKFNAF